MKRKYDPRKVKRHRSYTVERLAALYQVQPNTVRQWIKKHGLPTIEASYPVLMHWEDIRTWLTDWQAKRKWTCAPDEMSCFTCNGPRRIRDNSFWIESVNTKKVTLHGDCVKCAKTLNRFTTPAKVRSEVPHFTQNSSDHYDPITAHTSNSQSPLMHHSET